MPRPSRHGDAAAMFICRAEKFSHTYTKHISTVRNHSTEVQWCYTFQHYSLSTLLSRYVIQYYMNIISLERTKVQFTRDVQCTKLVDTHELGWNLES